MHTKTNDHQETNERLSDRQAIRLRIPRVERWTSSQSPNRLTSSFRPPLVIITRDERTNTRSVRTYCGVSTKPPYDAPAQQADTCLSATPATPPRKVRKPRSAAPCPTVPLHQREIVTIMEAAAAGPKTANAIRHLIFMAEAYAKNRMDGKSYLAEFLKCIHRPFGQRRVYINLPRYLAFCSGNSLAQTG